MHTRFIANVLHSSVNTFLENLPVHLTTGSFQLAFFAYLENKIPIDYDLLCFTANGICTNIISNFLSGDKMVALYNSF